MFSERDRLITSSGQINLEELTDTRYLLIMDILIRTLYPQKLNKEFIPDYSQLSKGPRTQTL